jgi:hypothetical protein
LHHDLEWATETTSEGTLSLNSPAKIASSIGGIPVLGWLLHPLLWLVSKTPVLALQAKRSRRESQRELTYAQLVQRLRTVLEHYSQCAEAFEAAWRYAIARDARRHGRKEVDKEFADEPPPLRIGLRILVDEMDKIASDSQRCDALNSLKDLFRFPHVAFIVTVAESDSRRFRFRAITQDRDPYDSAFDEVLQVGRLTIRETYNLFVNRSLRGGEGYPGALTLLPYIWCDGHPRDMIRLMRDTLATAHTYRQRHHATPEQALHNSIRDISEPQYAEACEFVRLWHHDHSLPTDPSWPHHPGYQSSPASKQGGAATPPAATTGSIEDTALRLDRELDALKKTSSDVAALIIQGLEELHWAAPEEGTELTTKAQQLAQEIRRCRAAVAHAAMETTKAEH